MHLSHLIRSRLYFLPALLIPLCLCNGCMMEDEEEEVDPYIATSVQWRMEKQKTWKSTDYNAEMLHIKRANHQIWLETPTDKIKISQRPAENAAYLRQHGTLAAILENQQVKDFATGNLLATMEHPSEDTYILRAGDQETVVRYHKAGTGETFCETQELKLISSVDNQLVMKFVRPDFNFTKFYANIGNIFQSKGSQDEWLYAGAVNQETLPFSQLGLCLLAQSHLPFWIRALWISSLPEAWTN